MTNFIRTGAELGMVDESLAGSGFAIGAALSIEPFIEVNWLWFILSLVLLVSGLVFLLGTIAVFRNDQAPLWKNSTLALLMHGLDAEHREKFARIEGLREMDEAAEGMVMRLQFTSDGLKVLSRA